MITYTLSLKLKDSQESWKYSIDLNTHQENKPELYFSQNRREEIRQELQSISSCKISNSHLKKIIATWIEDIKEGYRDTSITLALPYLLEANCDRIQESGYQEKPQLIFPTITDIEPTSGCLPPLFEE